MTHPYEDTSEGYDARLRAAAAAAIHLAAELKWLDGQASYRLGALIEDARGTFDEVPSLLNSAVAEYSNPDSATWDDLRDDHQMSFGDDMYDRRVGA